MIKIRQEQYNALGEIGFERFVERMALHLRGRFPEQTKAIAEDRMRALVRDGVVRANGLGIRMADNLRTFLEFETQYGACYYQRPEHARAGAILESRKLNEIEKLNGLSEIWIFGGGRS